MIVCHLASGVNFCGFIFFFLRELIFVDPGNIRQISCHIVKHSMDYQLISR